MLKIHTSQEDGTLYFDITGRIDSITAPKFEQELNTINLSSVRKIVIDCARLDFISSAGLRVLLKMRNHTTEDTVIEAINVTPAVKDIFDITGFSDIITIHSDSDTEGVQKVSAAFFDIDGTLLSHATGQVPQSTKDAIAEIQSRGIKAIICTGRDIGEVEKLPLGDIPFDGYLTLNGNLCLDKNKKMFAGNPIDPGEVDILVRIFQASRIPFVLIGETKRYINYVDDVVIDTQASTKGTIPDIGEYRGEKIYQCLAFVKDKERIMLENMLDMCTITSWNKTGIDIISRSGGKAAGLELFLDKFDLRRGETMAFGDGQNDIEMIRYAGIGIAMGNALDTVKAAADYVTTDIDDDGIANALRHFKVID